MSMLSKLRQARQQTLAQIAAIEEMRRGSVIGQVLAPLRKSRTKTITLVVEAIAGIWKD